MPPSEEARFFLAGFLIEDRFERAASGRERFFAADVFDAARCEVHSAFADATGFP